MTFKTYKAAWQWVEQNPNYLIKNEPKSATQSLASPGASGRSSPDMLDSQTEPSVEITPVVTGGETSEKVASVPNAKQPKLRKKFVPTPVANKQEEKKAKQVEVQSQNLLNPESDTEYQSQSLLLPIARSKTT